MDGWMDGWMKSNPANTLVHTYSSVVFSYFSAREIETSWCIILPTATTLFCKKDRME